MTDEIKIGDTLYVYDINRRVYKRDANGRSFGFPIYREHFKPVKIIGQTSRSWLYGVQWHPDKAPKNNPWKILHTLQMVDDKVWAEVHSNIISDAIRKTSVENLRKIAEIIGYKGSDA